MVAGCEDAGLEIRDQLLWLHGRGVPKSQMLANGVSTTLKPTYEPIMLARAPLTASTAAGNIAEHGTGGLNIAATRVARRSSDGYWPSHILLSHDPDCAFDECAAACAVRRLDAAGGRDSEPLSRLFYAAKADRAEREAGLGRLPRSQKPIFSDGAPLRRARANIHPTVKPIGVMRWLVRLITPPGGLVLDPFAGSGTTGCGAALERRQFLGIERDTRYLPIARARLAHWAAAAPCPMEIETLAS
jgi:site-specific DNA-methyltransferase (adenine-specific)